ncbi:MAG: transcriptional regulator, GntR family [Actinomycetia bacterium]|jgi:GntR family transcriptional regulator|nr:transcriptional regulator, GntR family [Actinomycetes bacterium]
MGTIDPHSPIPKYSQLRELLLGLMEDAQLPVDSPIPSERELCQQYVLSRMTVRQAVDQLVSEGRLYRVPGKGTFVARPKIDMPLRLVSFTEDMRARGMEPGARELDRRSVVAGSHLARAFQLDPGAELYVVERLRTADGHPMAIERSHIPAVLAPGLLDLQLNSLYDVLANTYGIVFDAGEQTIEAAIADPSDAKVLEVARGSAVLRMEQRSYAGGVCAELVESLYRADRFKLHTALEIPRTR